MITEVYINDQLFDLSDDTTVAASYGNISFGELNKRKGVKSNTWQGPFSIANKNIFESCEVPMSNSEVPYRRVTVRVDIQGVTVFEGWGFINEAEEGYSVQSFAGATDFYNQINNSKLQALDLTQYSHVWNETSIKNSWANTSGFIYSFAEYGKEFSTNIPPDYLLPQLFFKDVIKAITTAAGYTMEGDVLQDVRFKNHLILLNTWPLPIVYGGTWDNLALALPDLVQSKVWLDFANIYGLQFEIDDAQKHIIAYYIDDALFNDVDEWTDKVDRSGKRLTRYRFDDYGQISYLRYKYDALDDGVNPCYQSFPKSLQINDEALRTEADIYKSEFYLIQDVDPVAFPDGRTSTRTFTVKEGGFAGIWNSATAYVFNGSVGTVVWYNGSHYRSIQTGTNKVPPAEPTYWKAVEEKDVWDIKSRPMYGTLVTNVSSEVVVALTTPETVTRIVDNKNMDWPYTFDHHYRLFERIVNKTKRVKHLVKLSYSDINQLRFDRLKRIDGELYIVDEVSQYLLNSRESAVVEFIRI